jgi:glyoxylase I family protein
MSFELISILHSSVIVTDTDKALEFYHHILGLEIDDNRPELGFPGAWLKVGEQQIHLLELSNPDPVTGRPAHGGRDRHVALAVKNMAALQQRLEKAGINYTRSQSGRNALFTRDPDGNALEFIEQ